MRLTLPRPQWCRVGLLAAGFAGALVGSVALLDRLLPPDLSRLDDVSVTMNDADGRLLRAFTTSSGAWRFPVRADDVDARYRQLLIAIEDKRFADHPGVDPLALGRALGQWIARGRVVSGASTLTMQTVRLLEPRPRTVGTKFVEIARALQLEWRFSKHDILSMYLTLAPFGGNLEGVRAATRFYFGKEPDHLTAAEAALLVALPQSPERLRPDRFPEKARNARDRVLTRFESIGLLDATAAAEAREQPVPKSRRPAEIVAPHLADRLRHERRGAVVFSSYIDGNLQRRLEALAKREQAALEPGAAVALLIVENAERKVRAYIGSGDYFAEARRGQNDMVRAVRSPGSTLKPFIYGLGFDELLIHPETIVNDTPMRFGDYAPENFDHFYRGDVTVREALQLSLNLPAVALLDRLGPGRLVQVLDDAGAALTMPRDLARPGLPIALGGAGTSLDRLVMLYAALADGGRAAPLRLDDAAPEADTAQIASAAAAWYLTRILEEAPPPESVLPRQHRKQSSLVAFKTGTSYGFRDAWAIGYDRSYTVGVWVGRPDGTFSPGRIGRDAAAPVLFEIFDQLPPPRESRFSRSWGVAPPGVVLAGNADLPEALRRYQGGRRAAMLAAPHSAPVIAFPADATTLDLRRSDGSLDLLPLQAKGGAMPLLWLVNGLPIPSASYRRQAQWRPDGAGFARITVMDRIGRSASVGVWIQ